jgi:hypothetical protein
MNKGPTLRAWLGRQPVPHAIQAEKEDGTEKTVQIGVARSKFRDAENCLKGCIRCVALDEKGNELRVWEADTYEELREERQAPEADPLSSSVERIAAIITEACDRAVQRHAEMVTQGFSHMSALVQVLSNRNAALEKAWQQMFFSQQQPNADGSPNDALMGTLMQLALGGGIAPPAPKPPNGAAPED